MYRLRPSRGRSKGETDGGITVTRSFRRWLRRKLGESSGSRTDHATDPSRRTTRRPETTIVLDESARGRGVGTRLLGALLDELTERSFHRAIAIISMPNDASIVLHKRLGYRMVGVMSETGFKLGRYWDVAMMEREL